MITNLAHSILDKWRVPFILALIIAGRVILQGLLYRSGFLSITADEFGRTVLAAYWSQNPSMVWSGDWLPFHIYLLGVALWFKWDLLNVPRLITIFLGALSIPIIYLLGRELTGSRRVGFISAILLAVNPAHIWLSSTPLAAAPHTTLVMATILSFTLYLKRAELRYLYVAGFLLAQANGFRFESWVLSVVFSFFLLGQGILFLRKEKLDFNHSIKLVIGAAISWVVPATWMVGTYLVSDNPIGFLDSINIYKLTHYGQITSYRNYLNAFLLIDPFATIIGVLGLIVLLNRFRKSWAVWWYVTVAVVPLSIFAYLHGGQIEPQGNYYRYLTFFVIITYPAIAYLIEFAIKLFAGSRRSRDTLVGLIVSIMVITQIQMAFRYQNDPSALGLAVGQGIRSLRIENPELSQRPVLVELSYWQNLAIQVGANDVSHIIYDRELDIERGLSTSLLITDVEAIIKCISSYDISHIIVKSPEQRAIVDRDLRLSPLNEINGYVFYPLSKNSIQHNKAASQTCPLTYPIDY